MERIRIWFVMRGVSYLKLLWLSVLCLLIFRSAPQDLTAPLLILFTVVLVATIAVFLHHKPQERLNEYFIAKSNPLSKYKNIYQSVNRKQNNPNRSIADFGSAFYFAQRRFSFDKIETCVIMVIPTYINAVVFLWVCVCVYSYHCDNSNRYHRDCIFLSGEIIYVVEI